MKASQFSQLAEMVIVSMAHVLTVSDCSEPGEADAVVRVLAAASNGETQALGNLQTVLGVGHRLLLRAADGGGP